MTGYTLCFDVGTTNVKGAIVSMKDFRAIYTKSVKAEVVYPKIGYAEIDVDRLWGQITYLASELYSIADREVIKDLRSMVFTAHMAGVIPIDVEGHPLRNGIIWLDERGKGLPRELFSGVIKISGYNIFRLIEFLRITGGAPSKTGKDPLSKILWIKENEPDIYRSTYKFLDVKGYLIYRATGGIYTSPDEAHLTWLADTRSRVKWSRKLLDRYGIDESKLPLIGRSIDIAGYVDGELLDILRLRDGLPVFIGAGDLTTAALGSGAVEDGVPHIYVGTSSWIAAHTPKRLLDISHYMGTLYSAIPDKYLFIAEQEVAGAALDYFMDLFNIDDYRNVDKMLEDMDVKDSNLIFLPWMYGERAPIDDPYLGGGLLNLRFEYGVEDILRAVLEGVALNIGWAYQYFKRKIPWNGPVYIVGGGAKSDIWVQIISDILNNRLVRPIEPENAGVRGSAIIASVGLNIYKSFQDAARYIPMDKTFKPKRSERGRYQKLQTIFNGMYDRLKDIYRCLNG